MPTVRPFFRQSRRQTLTSPIPTITLPKPPEWVRIQSGDGYSFIVKREVAMASGTLERMLDMEAGFGESESNTCKLQTRGVILAKVLDYLAYKVQYSDAGVKDNIPDFAERIEPEIALELLMAADFLEA